MITHIRMKNFKSWKDSGEVKLAPLTGFFGTNSSGKSSLLQMLLLLKQTIGTNKVIFFGDENSLVNLGDFQEVIHGHKEQELLELEFGYQLQKPLTITILHQTDIYRRNYEYVPLDIDSFIFDTAIQGNFSNPLIEHFSYTVGPEAIQKINWKGGRLYYGNIRREAIDVTTCYGRDIRTSSQLLSPLSSAFENLFSHVYYLGPTRVNPRRYYQWEGRHPEHPGQWGNQAVDALLSARVRNLKTLHKAEEVPIEQRVSHWLREMDLAHLFSLDWMETQGERTYAVRIKKTPSSPPVTLVDMGYGLTQFLPVLVLCYYAPEGSTLIFEQPGIHLHPKVQSQLADLLIEIVTERKLQILIESHSEHLLNRLQRRIAEEKINVDKTALYFCRNDEGVSRKERLIIDEFGNIENWPENFFGDEMGDLFAMTKAQRERQKKAEG